MPWVIPWVNPWIIPLDHALGPFPWAIPLYTSAYPLPLGLLPLSLLENGRT